jgi:glycopeptide antibiotics resistance protein
MRPKQLVDWLLQAWLLGLVILSLMPLDLTINPVEIYQKFKSGRVVLLPFTHDYGGLLNIAWELVTDVLIFVPVGMLAVSFMTTEARPVRDFRTAILIGFSVVLAIELGQLLVMSRFTDATDLITGSAGMAAGVWLMRRWRGSSGAAKAIETAPTPRPAIAGQWLLFAGLYGIVLVALFWAPFDFTTDKRLIQERLSDFFSLPLSAAVRGSRFGALTALVRKVLLFIPLGVLFVMVARPLPTRFRRLLLGVLLVAGWCLALGIELGQVLLPGRAAVFDDVFVCALGIIAGMVATSRIVKHSTEER